MEPTSSARARLEEGRRDCCDEGGLSPPSPRRGEPLTDVPKGAEGAGQSSETRYCRCIVAASSSRRRRIRPFAGNNVFWPFESSRTPRMADGCIPGEGTDYSGRDRWRKTKSERMGLPRSYSRGVLSLWLPLCSVLLLRLFSFIPGGDRRRFATSFSLITLSVRWRSLVAHASALK
jgi:hypothetical protein